MRIRRHQGSELKISSKALLSNSHNYINLHSASSPQISEKWKGGRNLYIPPPSPLNPNHLAHTRHTIPRRLRAPLAYYRRPITARLFAHLTARIEPITARQFAHLTARIEPITARQFAHLTARIEPITARQFAH